MAVKQRKRKRKQKQKETRQPHQVTYIATLHLFLMELCGMPFPEAVFLCREMKAHIPLPWSAPNETVVLLFLFQIANVNSSCLLLKTSWCILINPMPFPLHNFILVGDDCSLCSFSLSEVERSSPLPLSSKYCVGSWLCWRLNKQKTMLKIISDYLKLFKAF